MLHDPENIIAVYMMSTGFDGPIYTGVTANLQWRVMQHKRGEASVFTRKYRCSSLVWWEHHWIIVDAIHREKRIKKWPRRWKVKLIEEANPDWHDRWGELSAL